MFNIKEYQNVYGLIVKAMKMENIFVQEQAIQLYSDFIEFIRL